MYDLCCCCLELPSRKSLWSEYEWMGQIEVYGQMLKECFNLIWPQNEFSRDQICEVCITQIRNAMQFRQRVVQSQAQLQAKLIAGGEDTVKIIKEENFDIEVEENEMDRLTVFTNTQELNVKDDEIKSINIEIEVPCDERTQDTLSDDIELIKTEQSYEGSIFADVADTSCTEIIKSVKRKSPTKNRKATSKRTELIKTEQCDDGSEDFSDDADTSPKIRKSVKRKASGKDRKVIVKRKNIIIIPKENTKKDKEEDKIKRIEFRNVSYEKPRQNAALILEHSTIVPFKSTKGYFTCLYCNKQHVIFEELKTHIQQAHDNLTFKTITKSINRPHDRIKADVSDITCRICKKNIDNLENFVSHLIDIHNIKFIEDDVKKPADSILAYDLSNGKFKCCVCKSEFLFFKTLTYHMNTHSNDYVCDVCGRCFLLAERLRAHVMKHIDVKSVKCNMCDKVCSSQVALHSHIRHQHKKLSYMCSICNLTFNSYKLRMKHLEEVHKRAPLNLTCKVCSKQYTQPNTLNAHMRLEHLKIVKEPKHACSVCGMLFKTQSALAAHFLVHSGEKKFECDVCHKKYARAKTLREHVKIHRNDRRWSCSACAQAFVQKCSLKNHIRVHHPDSDYGELIVYKKSNVDCK